MKIDTTLAAVVTGGASGLGRASAKALADAGVKVAVFDISEDRLITLRDGRREEIGFRWEVVEERLLADTHFAGDFIETRGVVSVPPEQAHRGVHDAGFGLRSPCPCHLRLAVG